MGFYLRIIGIASPKIIDLVSEYGTKYDILDLTCLFCSYSEFDIPIGHTFPYLVDSKSQQSLAIFCQIKLVTQAWGVLFDQVPSGHKTFCFVKLDLQTKCLFEEKLVVVDDWGSHSEYFYLSDIPTAPSIVSV